MLTRFTVTDTGRGIKPADRTRLFSAFEQIESSGSAADTRARVWGSTSVRRWPRSIGASITFESEFGNGSAFTLELAE